MCGTSSPLDFFWKPQGAESYRCRSGDYRTLKSKGPFSRMRISRNELHRVFRRVIGSPRPESTCPSEASETVTTTHWPKPSFGCSKPRSSNKGAVHIFGSSGCNAASPPIGEVGLAPVFEAAFDGEQSVGARLRPAASGWRNSASCALPAMMPSAAR